MNAWRGLGLAAFLIAAVALPAPAGARAHAARARPALEQPARANPPNAEPARIAVAGASVSAGFSVGRTSPSAPLARVIEASVGAAPVGDLSSAFAFAAPERSLRDGVGAAVARRADVLVALDGLFWFAYGAGDDAARERRFERGLEILDGFAGELLVGDLPDFRAAGVDPLCLPRSAIPSRAALERMNARLAAWAADRPRATVVPIAHTVARVLADEGFEVRGNRIGSGARARLFQRDGLHTTREGACVLWVVAADAWLAREPDRALPELDLEALVAEVARPAAPSRPATR